MIECIIKSPKKRKAPSPKNRGIRGTLILESNNEVKDYLEKNVEECQMDFDNAETDMLKRRADGDLDEAIEVLVTYTTLVNHVGNVTEVINEMEDNFPRKLLCKYNKSIQKKVDKMHDEILNLKKWE